MRIPPVLLSLLLLGACASPDYRLEAVGPGGELGREARYLLRSDDGLEGTVFIRARGYPEDEVEGRHTDTVEIGFVLDNRSDAPLGLELASVGVQDDQGRRLQRIASFLPPESGPDRLIVPPGTRTSAELVFDLGGPGTLVTTGSLTVEWRYVFRGKDVSHRTRFLPVRYVRETYHVPVHYGFHYGYYW